MQTFVTIVHVLTCILLVLVVLVQSGKGAEISASFGGSSQTVFGASGGANFFTRFTSGAAIVFMVTSIVLTLMSGQNRKSVFETGAATAATSTTSTATTGTTSNAPANPGTPAQGKDAAKPSQGK